jgi:hypothetical protein
MRDFHAFEAERNGINYAEKMPQFLKLIEGRKPSNPIKSAVLENLLGVAGASIRKMVNMALDENVLICSCGDGYYLPQNIDDVAVTINHLRERIGAMQNRVEKMHILARMQFRAEPVAGPGAPSPEPNLFDETDIF